MGSISKVPFPTPTNSLQWADDIDFIVGAPKTPANEQLFISMANAESPSGFGLNPAGNTQQEPGSTPVPGNSAGVQEYSSWATSLAAMASVIEQSNNSSFLSSLRSGTASKATLAQEITAPGASWAGDATPTASTTPINFTTHGPAGTTTGTGQDQGLFGRVRHDIAGGNDAASGAANSAANAAGNAVSSAISGALSGVLSPILGDLERDIYDWAFIAFGLILIVVGLVVTFKGPIEDGAQAAAPLAAAAAV